MTSYEQLNQLAELTGLFSSLKISPVDIRAFDEITLISPDEITLISPDEITLISPEKTIKINKNKIKKNQLTGAKKPDDVNVPIESKVDTNVPLIVPLIGWLYIFYSLAMPGLYKIGMTNRTVEARLAEANIHFTYGVPIPYTCLYAIKVEDALAWEKKIHKILDEFRVNPKYEFFRVTFERIKSLFDEIPGEVWVEQKKNTTQIRNSITNFDDHQLIRYKNYIGVYNREEKGIIHNDIVYKSLSKFAQACDPTGKNINGWKKCEYLSESGEWLAANNK